MTTKYNLIVVGCGGTGTYFLKEICRFLSGSNLVREIHVFDGDIVERKNLSRQCFDESDIGLNKAVVMGEVLSTVFHLPVIAHDRYLLDAEDLNQFMYRKGYSEETIPVVIGCVDNHGARLIMEDFFYNKSNNTCILFDSGNEYATGEISYAYKRDGKVLSPARSYYFPEIKNGDVRNRDEISCEELNAVEPQHFVTNMMAGQLLCSAFVMLLDGKLKCGVSVFNAMIGTVEFYPYRSIEEKSTDMEQKSAEGGVEVCQKD